MDGAKSVTDTIGVLKDSGRQVSCLSGSQYVSVDGSSGNKNPGGSKICS
jgi:hypothetical protein